MTTVDINVMSVVQTVIQTCFDRIRKEVFLLSKSLSADQLSSSAASSSELEKKKSAPVFDPLLGERRKKKGFFSIFFL